LEVEGTLLVTDLKRRVEEQLALPSATQTLVFRGKTLTDESSLISSGLSDGCKLHLVTRQAKPTNSEGRSGDDVFVLLGRILAKHLTPEQTARVMLEFRKNLVAVSANMSLDDVKRFVDSNFSQF